MAVFQIAGSGLIEACDDDLAAFDGLSFDATTGDDTVSGGDGDDTLDGGAGNDVMIGGAGNDTYYVDAYFDQTIEVAGGGIDHIITSISRTLAANIENLTMIGPGELTGNGNELANVITGNSSNNYLRGYGGDDTLDGGDWMGGSAGGDVMVGGSGNDTYYVDAYFDFTIEEAGGGIDHIISWIDRTLAANVENLTLAGPGHLTGNGNGLSNVVTGNIYNNILRGYDGADMLTGGAGNDKLLGGTGIDTMIGGSGDDTFYVDTYFDQTIEAPGAGADHLISSISRTLAANIESLTLTGSDNLTGNGNALGNRITGNAGDNLLRGYAGSDTLLGGSGNDRLDGGADNDQLEGGAGNDTLDGGAGADILEGGAGRDNLLPGFDSVRDILRFLDPSESTGADFDRVFNIDLDGEDQFDFNGRVASVGGTVAEGRLETATFDSDVATAVDQALGSMGAVLFTPNAGDLGGMRLLIVDRDGNGAYDAGGDYVVHLGTYTGTLTLDDFI